MAIIYLCEVTDLSSAYLIPNKDGRAQYVCASLLETASHCQELFDWLISQGANPQRQLTANAITATSNGSQIAMLAGYVQVEQITLNHQLTIIPASTNSPVQPQLPTLSTIHPDTPTWNIAKIRADGLEDLWHYRGGCSGGNPGYRCDVQP